MRLIQLLFALSTTLSSMAFATPSAPPLGFFSIGEAGQPGFESVRIETWRVRENEATSMYVAHYTTSQTSKGLIISRVAKRLAIVGISPWNH